MKKSIILFLLLCFVVGNTDTYSQIKEWSKSRDKKSVKTQQWVVNDLIFKTKKSYKSPYEKNVFAVVNSQKTTQRIPLFYDGNNTWVLRFSSGVSDTYTYTIEGDISELKGKKGKIYVSKNLKENRHGGIVAHLDDPKHFFYEDGSHYFNLAFECDWLFALDYGKKELEKTDHLLDLIQENGFNQIVMNVYSHDVRWNKDELLAKHPEHEYGGRQDIFPFLGSNEKPDFSALNPAFFQHLDRVISNMHDREIVSHLMIYVWNKLVAWPDMNTLEDNRYFDYVVKRYQAFPNMVFDVSKEALYYGRADEAYISDRVQRIRDVDSYDRLVSVHDYKFCTKHSNEVDFISTQDWAGTLYQKMIDVAEDFPNKPIFNIEHGGYEESPYKVFTGDYVNAETCLRRNYECLFAGVYTTYYWQGTSWNAVIHNPFEQPDDFYKPRFDYFKHMRGFFEKFPFEKFKPTPWHNSSGYSLTNEEDGTLLMYMPKENYAVSIGFYKGDKDTATMQWFNTLTGEYTEVKDFVKWKADKSPWRGEADTILIVRKK